MNAIVVQVLIGSIKSCCNDCTVARTNVIIDGVVEQVVDTKWRKTMKDHNVETGKHEF